MRDRAVKCLASNGGHNNVKIGNIGPKLRIFGKPCIYNSMGIQLCLETKFSPSKLSLHNLKFLNQPRNMSSDLQSLRKISQGVREL